jgi:hypothetical protein
VIPLHGPTLGPVVEELTASRVRTP